MLLDKFAKSDIFGKIKGKRIFVEQDESMDSAILSNIIDNLYPDDAISVLEEIKLIMKNMSRLIGCTSLQQVMF